MKKWIVAGLILIFWAHLAYGKQITYKKVRTEKNISRDKVYAEKEDPFKAYIVMEGSTGKILEGENTHLKWPPASITKLILAYIVMEKLSKGEVQLTDKITISKNAARIGGSQVFLKEGEAFTLEELMKATMVASANDAAYAIGEFLAGSNEEFISLMNEKAKTLNMVDTEYHSVHGLPPSKGEQADLTSCNDLAILARELLKYPKLLEWTSNKSEGFRDGKFIMNNHNKLLIKMPGLVDGLKTGYYRKSGYNIVVTAKKGDLRFIVVVMGSPKSKIRDNIVMEKLKRYFSQYKILNIVKKGELIDKDIILEDGKYRKIKGIANASFLYPIPNDKKGTIKKEIIVPERIKGVVKEGQKLGEMVIKLDNETIGKLDIVSPVYVPMANLFTRLIRKLGLNI
jgi:D-alanyl-D-alanine carboxypeptidase (penicillin-binding protein 5/6)